MPREIRTLKRSFFTDEKLTEVPRGVRLTFLGLISNADDYGRLRADPRLVKAAVYPLDDEITSAEVAQEIGQLVAIGRVRRYEVSGTEYLEIANFAKHQVMNRKYTSEIPEPADAVRTQCAEDADAVRTHGRSGAEKGEGAERSGAETPTAPLVVPADPPPPARRPSRAAAMLPTDDEVVAPPDSLLAMLPPEARTLLERFYQTPAMTPAQRERYRDVAMQLVDALDPNHPGPKVRGGQRVKARSVEHMADVCRAVMRDPPNDRDVAVLWVLKKLLDPPKGPSVTEAAKRVESSRIQLEERYHAEAKRAGIQWANDHPDEYAPILAAVEATYRGRTGQFAETAKQSELTQRCAKEAGFPSFDDWRANQRASA